MPLLHSLFLVRKPQDCKFGDCAILLRLSSLRANWVFFQSRAYPEPNDLVSCMGRWRAKEAGFRRTSSSDVSSFT
ncbi:hypothetical protein WG66_008171 [Moniliophthora roreri]|nr:hypothetical protein WG66_008171 [Moniliophthora roreri]